MNATVRNKLDTLVTDFRLRNYKILNESQVRLSFIDKFWKALGWDVSNPAEVQVEQTDRESKRPDYRFMSGNKTFFFVEAKRPAANLINPHHIYQTKLYCWNASSSHSIVPIAILTDFEEFRPFVSIGKPDKNDPKKGIIKQFDMTFEQYPDRADELYETFGKEAVLSGSLNKFFQPTPRQLSDTVDKDFLNTLGEWREKLAANIALRNNFDNEFDLSEAVQRILDRLVFIRILQDREVEPDNILEKLLEKGTANIYRTFLDVCSKFAPKYNGLIFNPHPVSEGLKLDDSAIKPIIKDLLFENSEYRFDVIPVEMLGTIYERFLGDEIRLTASGRAKVETKPEVRKAGGVYYTPQYIVEYIVQNTVGKLLENCSTPEDVAKLKILDPACGSGTFLLGTFDALINWHENYFAENPTKIYEKNGKQNYLLAYIDDSHKTHLTTRMKGKILVNNIYGVDLDRQATEVAQMSLYIKVLEGIANEPQANLSFRDAILPTLEYNIKCGNSLIGTDYLDDDFFGLSERERRKIHPFDWKSEFPQVFNNDKENFVPEYFELHLKKGMEKAKDAVVSAGKAVEYTTEAYRYAKKFNIVKEQEIEYGSNAGFDTVIGNPPWGQKVVEFSTKIKNYFKINYPSSSIGILDLSRFFIERSLQLIKYNGSWGQVLPDIILLKNYDTTRKEILDKVSISKIDHWGMAFEEVNIECFTITGIQKYDSDFNFIDITIHTSSGLVKNLIRQGLFRNNIGFKFNLYIIESSQELLDKLSKEKKFSEYFEPHEGIHSGNIRNKLFGDNKINNNCKKLIFGRNEIKRYNLTWDKKWVNYSKKIINKSKGEYAGLGKVEYFENPKIVVRRTGDYILANLDYDNFYFSNNVFVCPAKSQYKLNLKYFLGILNSKLITWYFRTIQPRKGKLFAELKINILSILPIKIIDEKNILEKSLHDQMVALVERMLKLHNDLHTSDEFNRKQLQAYIQKTDDEIDALVYELYGLTEEEIKIVEGE